MLLEIYVARRFLPAHVTICHPARARARAVTVPPAEPLSSCEAKGMEA